VLEHPTTAVDFLEGHSEVRSVTVNANSLKVHTRQKQDAQQVASLLGEGGFFSSEIEPLKGSLEDVFLWLARADQSELPIEE
jgi:hypothetical protein